MRGISLVISLLCFALLSLGCTVQPDNTSTTGAKVMSGVVAPAAAFSTSDYADALAKAVQFYDANKCGPNAGVNNVFSWRGACHTTDGSDVGVNLNGGYHDAGDHVKFNMPAAYTASMLGWALMEYKDSFDKINYTTKLLSTLKYFTDYFLACHPDANTYYYQVGDGGQDHSYWGAPEKQTGARPTKFKADLTKATSDVSGQTAAALVIMYLNYKSVDPVYANKCLQAGKEIYAIAKNKLGLSEEESYYKTYAFYDDLSWAAIWLSIALDDPSYLANIKAWVSVPIGANESKLQNIWTLCWDDVYQAVFIKMADMTGDQFYKDAAQWHLDYWTGKITPPNGIVKTTPGGLRFLNNWGSLRYAAGATFSAMIYYKQTGAQYLKDFAYSQIDYALGKNPQNMSYEIGFGSKYPTHPHHRAANGWTYQDPGGPDQAAKYVLTGALVGGPDASDNYRDATMAYENTEVAIDYNAAFVGTLAALISGQVYSSSSKSYVSLSSQPVSSASVSSKSSVSSASSSSVIYTNPQTVPGKIEAESYNGMSGIQTESCSEGTLNVGWIDAGDWFEYYVNVQTAGSYDVEYRVATQFASGKIDMIVGGTTLASTSVPNTGGWQTWTTVTAKVNLAKGTQVIRLYASGELWNINWLNLKLNGASSSSVSSIISSKSSSSTVSSKSSSSVVSSKSSSSSSSIKSSSSSSSSSSSGGQYVDKTAPLSFDGSGEYFWKMTSIPSYINSWNLEILEINGVSFLNVWASTSQLPAKQNGYYYIRYKGPYQWSHFEAK